jgi:hypothetical protein
MCGNFGTGAALGDVFCVVGVKAVRVPTIISPATLTTGGSSPSNGKLDLAANHGSFSNHFRVELKSVANGFEKFFRTAHFSDTDGGTRVGGFDEQRKTQCTQLLTHPQRIGIKVLPTHGEKL